ncbi:DUF6005 family protein [Paenibacillus oryzisoli]|uniref:DUF6005 family protein n=1 Tax=Paenibacillus oryzisoli TaxID=1850517 RepID=UPI003D2D915E
MIEVKQTHCFLDCISYIIQMERRFDERPLYCGVWNAPFSVSENGISYYSDTIGMEGISIQFKLLYGTSITPIHNYRKSKSENYVSFKKHMAAKTQNQHMIILVDLYYLPYPNKCYQVRHRPHLLISHHFTEHGCFLIDPYFSWEGYVSFETLDQAFAFENLLVMVMLDTSQMQQPEESVIASCMKQQLDLSPSLLYTEMMALIDRVVCIGSTYALDRLFPLVEQVSVLAKRFHGYVHIYSFLAQALDIQVSDTYSKADELVQKWDNIVLAIVRLGIVGKHAGLITLKDKLMAILQLELAIKQELLLLQEQWGGMSHKSQV